MNRTPHSGEIRNPSRVRCHPTPHSSPSRISFHRLWVSCYSSPPTHSSLRSCPPLPTCFLPPKHGVPWVALPPLSLPGHTPPAPAALGLSFHARSPVGGSLAPEDPRSPSRVPSDPADLSLPPATQVLQGRSSHRDHSHGPLPRGLAPSVDPSPHHPFLSRTILPLILTSPCHSSLSPHESFCKPLPCALALPTLRSISLLPSLAPDHIQTPSVSSPLVSLVRDPLPSFRSPSSPLPSGPRHWLLSPPPSRDVKAPLLAPFLPPPFCRSVSRRGESAVAGASAAWP